MPLNAIARNAINELKESGVTNLTPDEIIQLNDVGQKQFDASQLQDADTSYITYPRKVGNIVLYPMTCSGADFIDKFANSQTLSPKEKYWVIPFSLCYGRNPDVLARIIDEDDLVDNLRAFRKNLGASRDEIDKACEELFGDGFIHEQEMDRQSILRTAIFFSAFDPEFAERIRWQGLAYLKREETMAEKTNLSKSKKADVLRWKKIAVELATLTGVTPDYWYNEDRRLVLFAYKKAYETLRIKTGFFSDTTTNKVPPLLISAIAEMRTLIAEIILKRKKAENGEQST